MTGFDSPAGVPFLQSGLSGVPPGVIADSIHSPETSLLPGQSGVAAALVGGPGAKLLNGLHARGGPERRHQLRGERQHTGRGLRLRAALDDLTVDDYAGDLDADRLCRASKSMSVQRSRHGSLRRKPASARCHMCPSRSSAKVSRSLSTSTVVNVCIGTLLTGRRSTSAATL